jgi:hypothetical protein
MREFIGRICRARAEARRGLVSRDSMSAKCLAKYPQGSILRVIHPPVAAGAGTNASR